MATPITKVKTATQRKTTKSAGAVKPKVAVKARSKSNLTGMVAGITDQVSIGARNIDPGMAQIDRLTREGRARGGKRPEGSTQHPPAKTPTHTPANPQGPARLDGAQPIANSGSGGAKIEVSAKPKYTAESTKWIQVQNQRHLDADQRRLEKETLEAAEVTNSKKTQEFDAPKTKGGSKLKALTGASASAAALYQLLQGGRKFIDGNYVEGGLEFAGGSAELFAEASVADKARATKAVSTAASNGTTQAAVKTATRGQFLKKISGPLLASAFAVVDAKHAFDSAAAGDEVAATEHGMNSAWGLASLTGLPAAGGAVAYSLTRVAMSNTGGDKFVTDYLESEYFSGNQAVEQRQDATNRSHAHAIGGLRGQDRVNFMRRYPKKAARAIIGLQTSLSESNDPQEKARIMQRLHEVRQAKDRAFG